MHERTAFRQLFVSVASVGRLPKSPAVALIASFSSDDDNGITTTAGRAPEAQ
jgi:hypothetical protein